MKKPLFRFSLAAALVLGSAPTAIAAGLNQMAQCTLVPAARFSATEDTAVGLLTDTGGDLYWQFYDQDGMVLENGDFDIDDNALAAFSLADSVADTFSGVQGFLLFCLDDNRDGRINDSDATDLTANALLIRTGQRDVAYIPTLPVPAQSLNEDDRSVDARFWTDDPIDRLPNSADDDDELLLRYFTDGNAGGDDTTLYVFTTRSPAGTETMTARGSALNRDVEVPFGRVRLNVIDAEAIPGLNQDGLVGSGFLSWDIPNDVRSVFAFSLVESDAFGAAQTLVGGLDGR